MNAAMFQAQVASEPRRKMTRQGSTKVEFWFESPCKLGNIRMLAIVFGGLAESVTFAAGDWLVLSGSLELGDGTFALIVRQFSRLEILAPQISEEAKS
jgi:hypothetical protein